METFKYGDKVTHPQHGRGTVHNIYPEQKLVQVFFDSMRPLEQSLVHPVSLTKIVPVRFEVRIEWMGGAVTLSGPLDADAVKRYLANLNLEDMRSYRTDRLTKSS